MNKCHLLGNLTFDPELRHTNSGVAVTNFRIAVNRRYTTKDGERGEKTAFVDCEAWSKGAELIAAHFAKGNPIIVHGGLEQDEWEDKETGIRRSKLKLRVEEFEFVPRGGGGDKVETDEPAPKKKAAAKQTEDDDYPPF